MKTTTQKVKHTPGPWKATHIGSDEFRQEIIVDVKNCGQVATILQAKDANLIAAAPELLEALKALYDSWTDACDFHGEDLDDEDSEAWEMSEQVLKAIAKAEGRVS